jgi:hypothetical protein
MSKGPTGVKDFNGKTYYHLELKPKDWCSYHKYCPIENNLNGIYCNTCKYQRKLDIPTLLAERGRS